jgi:hypothetical protein
MIELNPLIRFVSQKQPRFKYVQLFSTTRIIFSDPSLVLYRPQVPTSGTYTHSELRYDTKLCLS